MNFRSSTWNWISLPEKHNSINNTDEDSAFPRHSEDSKFIVIFIQASASIFLINKFATAKG